MSTELIRIPNLPMGQIVDEQGMPTDDELTFRQGLLSSLQNYMGNEGLVMPSQTAANILIIQNHQLPNMQYTCAFGTMIYNTTLATVMIAVETAPGSGIPIFKTVTLV